MTPPIKARQQPQALVQAQLDAFNGHDVEALLAIYAADAGLYQHPDTLLARGAEAIGARFRARFAAARPHARLLHRIAIGNHVIDQEIVDAWSGDGWSSTELVANYEVRDGRIARAWFISGSSTSLRPAQTTDIPRLEALIRRSGLALSAGFYSEAQAKAVTEHVFGVDSQLIADQSYFIIERDGEAIACGGWSRRRTLFGADRAKSGVDALLDPEHEAARIRAFFVAPEVARQGLGRRLLEHCSAQAGAAGFHALELAGTMPGVPLYLACGFALVEQFEIALAGDVRVPLARMRKAIAPTAPAA
ncbi:GNAT family N-acetyltransferase [Rugamonas sp. CCM 8940]|uniref:GNAT family N-acetyltransferase n=1 Tax=Rugamonas sp. CCM 8940 TaxID=2765359 RepID=UPI0018F30318|nr:GNAT family N-acetyltransferase [Rugamonas sp. CCM 8940]MBJ7310865.1 GNAT family N-acetyltransferase [Rugamonas sp. CCM 8940]